MARCTIAAATAESTPPDSAQIARPSPIWARIASTCSSTMLTIVQVGRQPAISSRKCSSTCWPCSVCSTSGCHCTPARPRPTSSNAATGVATVEASSVNPSGAAVTESPWDIQTLWWAGSPASRVPDSDHADGGAAVLARAGRRDLAPERLRHDLEAVAHAEHGHGRLEERRVEPRRTGLVDRRRPTRQHDRLGLPRQHLGHRHGVRHDLGVDLRLTHPPGDQLGVLGTEVDYQDQVVLRHTRSLSSVGSRGFEARRWRSSHLNQRTSSTPRAVTMRRPAVATHAQRSVRQGPAGEGGLAGPCAPRWSEPLPGNGSSQ